MIFLTSSYWLKTFDIFPEMSFQGYYSQIYFYLNMSILSLFQILGFNVTR